MSSRQAARVRYLVSCTALVLASVLAGCGGGGGGDAQATEQTSQPSAALPQTSHPPATLPLMVDSLGRELAEADFGGGDPGAAGADGTAFDLGPLANATVTLTDAGGTTRTATTDASGYYRLNIKGLTPPFIANVRRGNGTQWFSASAASVQSRGFVTINLSALTDKTLGYVAEAANIATGAASAVTIPLLTANPAALVDARRRISASLAAPLTKAGLDAAGYDAVSTPLAAAASDRHVVFLQGLRILTSLKGRTSLVWTAAGGDSVPFSFPTGVAVDAAGNVLVADIANNVVRAISPAGVVTTLAGTGQRGRADGPGATATFEAPASIGVDAQGNVYVADLNSLRKIAANGVVTKLLASNFFNPASFAGAFAVDPAGNIHFLSGVALSKLSLDGAVRTIATVRRESLCCSSRAAGEIVNPTAIAVDAAGNVYVAGAGAIVKVTPAGATSDLYSPTFRVNGLAADAGGTVYATDRNGVWRITPGGAASLLAGGTYGRADGFGTAAQFNDPGRIALDAAGNLFVADTLNNAIRKVTPAGEVTTSAGPRPGFTDGAHAAFGAVSSLGVGGLTGVAADTDGTLFVADSANHAIRKISPDGTVTTIAGNGVAGFSNGNGRVATFNEPNGVALDGKGNIFVSDSGNHVIRKITAAGDVTIFAGSGVQGFTDGQGSVATFTRPLSLTVGPGGDVYVADAGIRRNYLEADLGFLRRITAAGVVSTMAPPGLSKQREVLSFVTGKAGGPVDVALSTQIFCVEIGGCIAFETAIFSLSPDGAFSRITGTVSRLTENQSVAVDSLGNLYYALDDGRVVVRLTPAGVQTELLGMDGLFRESNPVAAYGDGLLVIADRKNAVVQIVML